MAARVPEDQHPVHRHETAPAVVKSAEYGDEVAGSASPTLRGHAGAPILKMVAASLRSGRFAKEAGVSVRARDARREGSSATFLRASVSSTCLSY